MSRKTMAYGVAAAVCVFSIGAWARPVSGQGTTRDIVVDNFTFTPQAITVPAGTTITWTNRDDIPHTIASTDKQFKSSALDTDQTYSHRFDTPGTYKYFCSIHPKMTAQVVVQ